MGSLEGSCTANFACEFLGAGVAAGNSGQGRGPVTSNLKDCCTYELACRQFNEAEIPSQCKVVSCGRIVFYTITIISCVTSAEE